MVQKVLVIVESPLQLINANEYLRKHALELNSEFYFLSSRGVNNLNQLKRTYQSLKLTGKVFEISVVDIDKNFSTRLLFYYKVIKRAKARIKEQYNLVLVGHMLSIYQAILANTFKNAKNVYLDDGNSSIAEQKTLRCTILKSFFPWHKRVFPYLIGLSANLKYFDGKLYFFTMYDELIVHKYPHLVFDYNDFMYLKSEYVKKEVQSDIVFFIGTPFYWQAEKYNGFKEDLKKISNFYFGKNVIYFPHRYESDEQLEAVKKLKWEVVFSTVPIELSLIDRDKLPFEFGMFYSSASFSISKLIPEAKFRSFEVANTKYLRNGENIFKLYREYEESENIEVINLN